MNTREKQLEKARYFLQGVRPLFARYGLTPFPEWHRNKYIIKARLEKTASTICHVATLEAALEMKETELEKRIAECAEKMKNE